MEPTDYIFGLRAVIEAIQADKEIDKVLLRTDLNGPLASELMSLLRERRILVKRVPEEKLNRITRKNHQGVIAMLSAVTYYRLDHLVPQLYEEGKLPFIVLLDGITDVRNFGAIARTCECAGVDAIVIPTHGSVSVGGDAVKASAGALLHIPVCRERNIAGCLRFLRDNGYLTVAATEKSTVNYTTVNYTSPVAVVMGAEDVGISPEALRECESPVAIPQLGNIGSLNVSVAAGIIMYEVVRQRLNADLEVI